jgi:hypothetical protein
MMHPRNAKRAGERSNFAGSHGLSSGNRGQAGITFPVVGDRTGRARRKTCDVVGTDGIVATIDGLVLCACFSVELIVVYIDLIDALAILTDAILVIGGSISPLLGIASGLFHLERRRVHHEGRKFRSIGVGVGVGVGVGFVVVVVVGPRWVDDMAMIGGWCAPNYLPSRAPRPLEFRPVVIVVVVVVVDYLQSSDAGQSSNWRGCWKERGGGEGAFLDGVWAIFVWVFVWHHGTVGFENFLVRLVFPVRYYHLQQTERR